MDVGFVLLGLLLFNRDVQCEKSGIVKVAVVFTFDSVIGRAAKVAMEMAVEDVNSDTTILNGTKLEMIMEDSSCNVFIGSIKGIMFAILGGMLMGRHKADGVVMGCNYMVLQEFDELWLYKIDL